MRCVVAFFVGSVFFATASAQTTKPEEAPYDEHFGTHVSAKTWNASMEDVKNLLKKKRMGNANPNNNDIYDDSLVDALIDAQKLSFQGEAVWLDVSLGSKFKDPERRKEAVFKRLQSEESLDRTKQFLEMHCYQLAEGYEVCGVPPEYVSGIANIETFFGSYDNVRKFPVLATLVTWVSLQNASYRLEVAKNIVSSVKKDETNKVIDTSLTFERYIVRKGKKIKVIVENEKLTLSYWTDRMATRAEKSLVQLRDYLNLAQTLSWENDKTLRLEGSWVGAFTDFQFMPVTFRYTMLENENPNPENPSDIIPLVTRYLGKSWGTSNVQIRKAIGTYNSPKWYVNHVDTVANHVRPYSIELMNELKKEQQQVGNVKPVTSGH